MPGPEAAGSISVSRFEGLVLENAHRCGGIQHHRDALDAAGFPVARLREKPREQQHRQQLHPQRDGRNEPLEAPSAGRLALRVL